MLLQFFGHYKYCAAQFILYDVFMAVAVGRRERKKQQTRQLIFEAARRLFERKGFDRVSVAEVAQAADVSEVTVFNYFPTKEDLYYGGMQFFEEQLLEAVRNRPAGESALKAFRRQVLEGARNLGDPERAEMIQRSARVVAASPDLMARERDIVDRYTTELAAVLAADRGSDAHGVEAVVAAAAMMGAHRALVAYTRGRVLAGRRGQGLAEDFQTQARRAFNLLARGLADYAG
jgi:AcrR family transcriptional regulator